MANRRAEPPAPSGAASSSSPDPNRSWLESRPARTTWADRLLALVLGVCTLAALWSTTDVGFPRDEGFYFRYSTHYQNWFYDLEDDLARPGDGGSLSRDRVDHVWRGNAEHPPLAKIAFGYSWRLFSDKIRPISRIETRADEALLTVSDVAYPDGFDIGQTVQLVRPASVVEPEHWSARVIGEGLVLHQDGKTALVSVRSGELSDATFDTLCSQPVDAQGVPTVMSGCAAVSEGLLGMSESTGFRFPAFVLSALLIAALYLFGATIVGRLAALTATLAFFFVPRHFFHFHMTAFDVFVTAMMFFTVVGFWHSLRSRAWVIGVSVIWGLAILTKHNAWFTPVTLGLWWLAGTRIRRGGGFPLRLPKMPWAFVFMLLIGLPLFVALWPRLWFDTWEHFRWYVAFHTKHDHYMQQYFGQVLAYPPFPWLFPFALTAMTLPLATLGLVVGGWSLLAARWWSGRRGRTPSAWLRDLVAEGPYAPFGVTSLLVIQALWPIALIAQPSTPVFGGVKHWMPAMPFVCLIGGVALSAAWSAARLAWERHRQRPLRRPVRAALSLALALFVVAPAAHATWHAHPDGTAYWNELSGGPAGASELGMQRQFWGYSTRHGLDYLNRHVPKGATVYFHKSVGDAYKMYQRDGLLRDDIRHVADLFDFGTIVGRIRRTAFAVFHHQKDHDEYELSIWEAYGVHTPVWQATIDGVPVLSVYRNPK